MRVTEGRQSIAEVRGDPQRRRKAVEQSREESKNKESQYDLRSIAFHCPSKRICLQKQKGSILRVDGLEKVNYESYCLGREEGKVRKKENSINESKRQQEESRDNNDKRTTKTSSFL